ncbi:DUF418 domain-containing protein [Sporosarcina sp. NPDC096371]|uniref:DUF418 domain-containing protein n=1 Tax=Sporosarcina sp. NPDC096371 TaxID=3364530 RepID=UPI00380A0C33
MVKVAERTIGIDVARSLAMFGMLIINYSVITGAEGKGPSWLIKLTSLIEGRASALFVILAGIGIALMTKRAREGNNQKQLQKARQSICKRALLLFVLGMGLYTIGWTGDILHYYGIYLFLLAFFIGLKKRTNLIIAGVVILVAQVIQLTNDMFTGWHPNALYMEYIDFWSISGFIRNLFINGYHPIFPWFAFILIGFVIGCYSLKDSRILRNLLAIGFTLLVIVEGASVLLTKLLTPVLTGDVAQFLFSTGPILPSILYMLSAIGSSLIILVIILMVTRKADSYWIWKVFVPSGQMTLTHYIGHIVIGLSILELLGRMENQQLLFIYIFSVGFYVSSVIFSVLWKFKFDRGPIEWLVRKLT